MWKVEQDAARQSSASPVGIFKPYRLKSRVALRPLTARRGPRLTRESGQLCKALRAAACVPGTMFAILCSTSTAPL